MKEIFEKATNDEKKEDKGPAQLVSFLDLVCLIFQS
jgi:hypothetical protein